MSGWDKRTHFNSVTVFKKTAERVRTANPGDTVFLRGRLQDTSYESDGEKKYVTEKIGEEFNIISRAKRGGEEE